MRGWSLRTVVIGWCWGVLTAGIADQQQMPVERPPEAPPAVSGERQTGGGLKTLAIDPAQIERLGMQWVLPEEVHEIPLAVVPAVVTVPPGAESLLSAPLAGLIEEVTVAQGDTVAAGQKLARLNSPELLTRQQRLLDAWQELKVAAARRAREQPLFGEGIIARSRWLETQKAWHQARTAFAQSRRELELLGMDPAAVAQLLRTGRLDGRLVLRAPRAGVVTGYGVLTGQRVDRLAPLFRITGTGELWLEMALPLDRVERLGPRVEVRTEPEGVSGVVFLVGATVDPVTQTVLVRARLTEPKGLRPGHKLTARLFEVVAATVLKVPRSAVVEHEGEAFVFVRTPEGFQVRPVILVGETAEAVFIRRGLREGEPVVSRGVAALKAAWLGVGEGE